VRDVLEGIHAFLMTPLRPSSYDDVALQAMHARIARSFSLSEVEQMVGLRRIDLLGDEQFFGGLRPMLMAGGVWALDLVFCKE
jgi:hypothetical protein